MVNHHSSKFGGHRHFGSGEISHTNFLNLDIAICQCVTKYVWSWLHVSLAIIDGTLAKNLASPSKNALEKKKNNNKAFCVTHKQNKSDIDPTHLKQKKKKNTQTIFVNLSKNSGEKNYNCKAFCVTGKRKQKGNCKAFCITSKRNNVEIIHQKLFFIDVKRFISKMMRILLFLMLIYHC